MPLNIYVLTARAFTFYTMYSTLKWLRLVAKILTFGNCVGIGYALDPDFSFAEIAAPYAQVSVPFGIGLNQWDSIIMIAITHSPW